MGDSRRQFLQGSLAVAGVGLLAGCGIPLPGQPPKIPVVGVLSINVDERRASNIELFRQALRELGYVEGQTIALETRDAQGEDARLPALAAELVGRGVAVIVAGSSPDIQAAKDATRSIPIVMTNSGDPVAEGFVASLSRPGGNVTGLTNISRQIASKRFDVFKELLPGLARLAVIWNPSNPAKPIEFADLQAAAGIRGVEIQSLEVRSPGDFEPVFNAVSGEAVQGLQVLGDPLTSGLASRIASFALTNRLPAAHEVETFPAAGGLMSYGARVGDQWRRGATYVDKILKGAKPAELPVEQPTKFDLVLNLKTARALGLDIPAAVLAQATEVIQ